MRAEDRVISAGYSDEIEWVKNIPPFEKCTPEHFFEQYVWCVLNLGVREQTMREEYNEFMRTLDVSVIHNRFKEKKKTAIATGINKFMRWFGELRCSKDPVSYLQTLPLIGKTTKWHLARNIGIDCPKPDRHMLRLTAFYGYSSAMDLCKEIRVIAPDYNIGTIDLILWRDCNLRPSPLGMVGNRDAEGIRRGGLGRPPDNNIGTK
jgi:hypothetical protein